MKRIDSKALKILMKYNAFAALCESSPYPLAAWEKEYVEKHRTTPEDMAYLRLHGLAPDAVSLKHNEAISKCFLYYEKCKKISVTNAFLVSLSSARLEYRSGLPAFAIMQTMPDHEYQQTDASNCKICCSQEENRSLDLTGLMRQRFVFGSMVAAKEPYEIQFFLQQHLTLEDVTPSAADLSIFNAIIDILLHAGDAAKPNEVAKKLRTIPGFTANVDQCKCLLEILGFCSILETKKHPGYFKKYTNPGLAPSKSHSSNWAYPVDFWTGKDGINREALAFWFGDYPEIVIPHA